MNNVINPNEQVNQETFIHKLHQKLGASFAPFAHWLMPMGYGSIKDEVASVRKDCGVFDVSHMGEFIIHGPDAEEFINAVICNDFEKCPVGKAQYSPILNNAGFCLDDVIVYHLAPQFVLMCVNASNTDKIWHWLNELKNTPNAKIPSHFTLKNITAQTALFALQGPQAESKLLSVFTQLIKTHQPLVSNNHLDIEHFTSMVQSLPYYGVMTVNSNLDDHENFCYIARTGYTGEDGFEIFLTKSMAEIFWENLMEQGVKPCGLAARDCLRLEVCYPLYGHEIDESVTPLDAGLKWTVKLQKKYFVGQDALINYKTKWKQIKFSIPKAIPRQEYLIKNSDGKTVGTVTSGTLSPTLNLGIALGRVEAQTNLEQKLFVAIREQLLPITILSQPFLQGGHK